MPTTEPPAPRRLPRRLLLAALAAAAAVVGAEVLVRLVVPKGALLSLRDLEIYVEQARGAAGSLAVDAELGHVPVLKGKLYDQYGLLLRQGPRGSTVAKREGVQRVLFLGDSVTMRGKLTAPLRELWPGGEVEFLNAGVESWNPLQEVEFYFRHQQQLLPDHVVLALHNNDLTATMTAFFRDGEFVLCRPGSLVPLDIDWYRWSGLYRLFVHARLGNPSSPANYLADADRVQAALRRLRDELAGRGARLTVLVLPIVDGEEAWEDEERQARERSLRMLQDLGIAAIDLLPAFRELWQAGVGVREASLDRWHPNAECGAALALAAVQAGLWGATTPLASAAPAVIEAGTSQTLTVRAGPELAGRQFLVLGSLRGIAPPAVLPRGRVPLADDAYLQTTLQAKAAPHRGVLDGNGEAVVQLPVPAAAAKGGMVAFHTVVVLQADGQRYARIGEPVRMVVRRPAD